MTILLLLIDSDIAFMVNIKKALEDSGEFQVSLATSPAAAADALRRVAHDVAVVDFDVPDRDVVELLRLLRNTQPGLPVIITPHDDFQYERASYLDVQGVMVRPFTARSLIPYVRDMLGLGHAGARSADQNEPALPDALRDLFPEDDPGGMLDESERRQLRKQIDFLDTESPEHILQEFEAIERAQTGPLDESRRPDRGQTHRLGDYGDEPPDTSRLPVEAADTDHLPGTETFARPGPLQNEEPPHRDGDTPRFPEYDADEPRQVLGQDIGEDDPSEFGEVLDAVARSGPSEFERSPHDRAFHELVDSLRGAESPDQRRTWLDDLLAAMAANAARGEASGDADSTLDTVLDAIRRGAPPGPSGEPDLDDTTIGEVISGLFDPSFESVLAVLSGQEVDESAYEEPSYTAAENFAPQAEDQLTSDEMSADDLPAWLADYEAGANHPPLTLPEPFAVDVDEPPANVEDSKLYPATTALSAAESDSEFSLDDLLDQIDLQIPSTMTRSPQLKPLPSWGPNTALGAPDIRALFDRVEPNPRKPDTSADPADEAGASTGYHDPATGGQDTRPSLSFRDEIEAADFQERDTQPYGPIIPSEGQAMPLEWWEDSASDSDDEIPLLSMKDLMALDDLSDDARTQETPNELARRAAASPPDDSEQSIAEAFYAGVRESYGDLPTDLPEQDVEPDDSQLIPVPVEEAARLLEGESLFDAEDAEIARAAVQLTQFSLESSAQVTILSRESQLLASAGDLPEEVITGLFDTVRNAWQSTTGGPNSLIRFVTVAETGDFLLYSVQVENALTLSMIFHADTPVRAIRRQARRLSETLELVPHTPESPAASTLPSRPTDLRPPAGLHEIAAPSLDQASESDGPSGPYTAYTCLWLPYDASLELNGDFARALSNWLQDSARENAWQLTDLEILPDYVLLTVSVPHKLLPDEFISRLMEDSARRSVDGYPDLVNGHPLWSSGYYVVSPPRPLTEREIARFVTYYRQAQI